MMHCFVPPHYSLISTPRNGSNKILSSGSGTAFLVRSSVHPGLPHQCNGITENIMPLPTRPLLLLSTLLTMTS